MFRQVRAKDNRLDRVTQYTYAYANSDRPDQLSYRLYGTTEYYWTFFVLNEHLSTGMRGWHMPQDVLDEYIDKTYNYHNIRLYREATDDINYNQIENMYGVDVYMYGVTSGAIGKIIKRNLDTNSLDFIYQSDVEFIEWEQITIVDLKNMYHDLGYVDWGYVLSTSTVEDIFDKYDVRPARYAVRHWWDIREKNYHNNYEHYDLTKINTSHVSYGHLMKMYHDIGYVDYGYVLPIDIFDGRSKPQSAIPVTNEEYEIEMNDRKNKVRVLRRDYVDQFSIEFRKTLNA